MVLKISALALALLILVACANATPTAPAPSVARFDPVSNSGGSVTVDVQLLDFQINQPLVFTVAMNTHSVDLVDDLTQTAILRDDAGKEYAPIAWEGAGPGGHHREGKLKFAAFKTKPKSVELVIKNLAQVSARTFRWEIN
ncbi:MAG: hypothetical protein HZC40_11850 [Chloroflexi bacterium]|nr:hypothetical protein [Chloroflexota bacterium]